MEKKSELYGTSEVARILRMPEWRVKNFTEGAAYRLPPALRVGSGRGSRRLYSWQDIFRLGIADELVKFGFTPESVGAAIREIPESTLAPYEPFLRYERPETEGHLKASETPLLINHGGSWRFLMAKDVQHDWSKTVKHGGGRKGLFVFNIANACDSIFAALERHWKGD